MEGFFLLLYDFFRTRRFLFFVSVLAILAAAGFIASRLTFEEDITKMISGGITRAEALKTVEQSGILDRMVFNISSTDAEQSPDTESMISIAERLSDSLNTGKLKPFVRSVTFRMNEDAMTDAYDIINRNLPVFLTDEDYKGVINLITPERTAEVLMFSRLRCRKKEKGLTQRSAINTKKVFSRLILAKSLNGLKCEMRSFFGG